jgi:Xaa-Pro aminopeptidase
MSMFSDVATEHTIKNMVKLIEDEIKLTKDEAEIRGLKRAGTIALTLFEWDTPKWAAKYKSLFANAGI